MFYWPAEGMHGLWGVCMIEIIIGTTKVELMDMIATQFVEIAKQAIAENGQFTVVLAGGSTPRDLYLLLSEAPYIDEIDWTHVYLFWGDERCVPPDDDASNYWMVDDALLQYVPIPPENVYRIYGELEPEEAAEEYVEDLKTFFKGVDIPVFDLILLGMGVDGHTASLFPQTSALGETIRTVVAHYVEKLEVWRITLTLPIINAAHYIFFIVMGQDKAETLKQVLQGEYQPENLPAQFVQPAHGQLIWFVDAAAASLLD